jgi:hypothetical protein
MQILVVDTNWLVKMLEQRGFSRTQAVGITEGLRELDLSSLATKNDLSEAVRSLMERALRLLTHTRPSCRGHHL